MYKIYWDNYSLGTLPLPVHAKIVPNDRGMSKEAAEEEVRELQDEFLRDAVLSLVEYCEKEGIPVERFRETVRNMTT